MGTLNDDDDEDHVAAVPAKDAADVDIENDGAPVEPEIEVIEDTGDERIAHGDDAEDDEGKPRRPKETAAERRGRAKQAKERDKRELDYQRRELARQDALIKDLQKGLVVTRVNDLDSRISDANIEAEQYDRIFGAAISQQKGDDARQAAQIRDAAREKVRQAQWEKHQLLEQAGRPAYTPKPYESLAREFLANNPWYDNDGKDADSRIVKEIDAQVAGEFVATSPRYWQELQRRVNKHFPDRVVGDTESDHEQPAPRRRQGPPTGGSSRSNSSTTTQVRLSPDRVAAMKESGKWDDPKARAKMAKAYAKFDQENQSG
jgi:hypothetical protein